VEIVTTMCAHKRGGEAASVNEKNIHGQTALHLAAAAGNAYLVMVDYATHVARTFEMKLKQNSKTNSVSSRRNCFISVVAQYAQ